MVARAGEAIVFLQAVSQGTRTRATMKDSVGKFCTDKRTRRTKDVLEEYERHEKQFENPFLLDEDADSCLSCFFRSFCSI